MIYLTTIALIILSISVLMLSRAVYRHLKMHLISSVAEEEQFNGDPGISKFYLDIFNGSMYTKRETSDRFLYAASNEQNRQLYPYRYRHGATLQRIYCSEGCTLVYLNPEESADLTYKSLTGGKLEYHSWSDIDRYFLKCSFGNSKPDLCPAFEELRKLLAVGGPDIASMCDNLCVRYEYDPLDGKVRTAYIGNGYGAIGPITGYADDSGLSPFASLSECCETCKFKRSRCYHKSCHSDRKIDKDSCKGDGYGEQRENITRAQI